MSYIACNSGPSGGSGIEVRFLTSLSTTSVANVSQTFNVSSILPNYGSLTADNFLFVVTNIKIRFSSNTGQDYTRTSPVEITSYDPSTGDVVVKLGKPESTTQYTSSSGNLYYVSSALPTS